MRCKELCTLPQVKEYCHTTSENVGNSTGQHALATVPYAYSMLNYASLFSMLNYASLLGCGHWQNPSNSPISKR